MNTKSGLSERNDYERLWGIEKNPELCFYCPVFRIFVALVAFTLSQSAWANKPVVAVFELKNEAKLKESFVKQLHDLVATGLTKNNRYAVVPNFEVQKALRQKQVESYKECYDESCQIEIGKEIAAEMTLATSIKKLGSKCIVTMQLFNLRTGASGKSGDARGACNEDSVVESVYRCVGQLTGASASSARAFTPSAPSFSGGQITDASGRLIVEGKPKGATLEINGPNGYAQTLSMPASLDSLSPGPYSIKVSAQGFVPQELKATVRAEQTELLRVEMQTLASIDIQGTPLGAKVEVYNSKGKKLATGSFPLKGGGLMPGDYRVVVSQNGYVSQDKIYVLTAAQTTKIEVRLLDIAFRLDKDFPKLHLEKANKCRKGVASSCIEFADVYRLALGVPRDTKRSIAIYRALCDEGSQIACALPYELGFGTKKDYEKAATHYETGCEQGSLLACVSLGDLSLNHLRYLRKGLYDKTTAEAQNLYKTACAGGVPAGCAKLGQKKEACQKGYLPACIQLKRFREACDGGSSLGCALLGVEYLSGLKLKRNKRKGLELLEKHCEKGSGDACYQLGIIYEEERHGIQYNSKLATKFLSSACRYGDMDSCFHMARSFTYGRGKGQKDWKKIAELHQIACQGEIWESCNELGGMYSSGKGVPKKLSKAKELYELACVNNTAGSAEGCFSLGLMYKYGRGVQVDYRRALTLLEKALNKSTGDSLPGSIALEVAILQADNLGTPKDLREAGENFAEACRYGLSEACIRGGRMYKDGIGVEKDLEKAWECFESGCGFSQDPENCYELSLLYREGQGVKKDLSKAKELQKEACDKGFKKACR